MTDAEKIEMVKTLCDETADSVISAYLYMAGQKVIKVACPKGTTAVPEEWDALHIDATVYMLNKRGAEGQQSHSENGISRSYESADLPASMLLSYGVIGYAEAVT